MRRLEALNDKYKRMRTQNKTITNGTMEVAEAKDKVKGRDK